MFDRATLKLTAWYLSILMAISIIFSIVIYNDSTQVIRSEIRHQIPYFQQLNLDSNSNESFRALIAEQEDSAKQHLQLELFFANLLIFVVAGFSSYMLARRSLRPIKEAMDAQGRFTADASHELRTPLTAMKSEIEVSLRDSGLSVSDYKDILVSNLEEIAKLESLSNGLLRLSRLDYRDSRLFESVSLAKIAYDAIEHHAKAIKKNAAIIYNEVEPVMIVGDSQHLTEVVAILLDNAIKYSPPKSSITLTSKSSGHFGYLEVTDKGPGIKPDDLPLIFDRFYRSDVSRTKDKVEGYGLGLSIAKKIIELHGGVIEVSSVVGEGTTFKLKLPLSVEA